MSKELEKIKVIKFKGDEFKFNIAELSVDAYVNIEDLKIILSGGNYNQLATSGLVKAFNAATIIDMIATFRILNKDIEKAVAGGDFWKLCIFDMKETLDMYVKEFLPWYNEWMKLFNSPLVPIEEDKKGEDSEK